MDQLYQEYMEYKEEFQNQYDEETNFSRNKEKQIEWSNKINDLLLEMEDFAGYNNPQPKIN